MWGAGTTKWPGSSQDAHSIVPADINQIDCEESYRNNQRGLWESGKWVLQYAEGREENQINAYKWMTQVGMSNNYSGVTGLKEMFIIFRCDK